MEPDAVAVGRAPFLARLAELDQSSVEQSQNVADDLLDGAVGAERQVRVCRHLVERLPSVLLALHNRRVGVGHLLTPVLATNGPLRKHGRWGVTFDQQHRCVAAKRGREGGAIVSMAESGVDDCASARGDRRGGGPPQLVARAGVPLPGCRSCWTPARLEVTLRSACGSRPS